MPPTQYYRLGMKRMKKLRDRKTGDCQQEVTDDLSEDSQKTKWTHFVNFPNY